MGYAVTGDMGDHIPPFYPDQAVRYAVAQISKRDQDWTGWCLAFSARVWGLQNSGYYDAQTAFSDTPDKFKGTSRTPPVGALCCWSSGSGGSGHGHIAPYVGHGDIISTDIRRRGWPDRVPMSAPENEWGQHYRGWIRPYYPKSAGAALVHVPPTQMAGSRGTVHVERLHHGVTGSDSVRYLQYRLNHSADVKRRCAVNGVYGAQTVAAVKEWQAKVADTGTNDGMHVSNVQANRLFGRNYVVIEA